MPQCSVSDPVRGAGVQRTPKTFRRISINSILVISLVDGVFGTGLDGVVGSHNVVFHRAREEGRGTGGGGGRMKT